MKIYTRTGDAGSTGLFGGPRVSKDNTRIEAYGTVDELNATIALVRVCGLDRDIDQQLDCVQHELFSIGAELATPSPGQHNLRVIGDHHIQQLEIWIDQHEADLEPLKQFILPGGCHAGAHLHLARAVCRRAERRVVTLSSQIDSSDLDEKISESMIIYLNRLSDYLFVLSRAVNHRQGKEETKWVRPTQTGP